jgi:hypothetical protein
MSRGKRVAKSDGKLKKAAGAGLDDKDGSSAVELYPALKGDGALVPAGTRINWNGKLKRAAADLWDTAENTPEAAPALWEDVSYYKGYRIIPEVITAALAFSAGEIGYWPAADSFYNAKNNGTVWTPTAYPAAWEVVEV